MGKNKSAKPGVKTYSSKELTGFLIGLAGQNIIYNVISSGFTYYVANVIFIPAAAYGVFFAIARVWDGINDPMMGSIVDRTRTKWGKCKPFLLFVPAIVCVTTILCFINGRYSETLPTWNKVLIIGWAAVSYILWGMSYTAGDIPLWGVTSLMTEDQNDRAKALSLARIVASAGAIGMLVQLAAPSFKDMFIAKGASDAAALQYSVILLAVIVTVVACILFQFAGFSVKEKVQQSEEHYTMKENFKTMWGCKPFRQLLVSGVLRSPIQLLSLVGITLVMYFYFDNDPGKALFIDGKINVPLLIQVLIVGFGILGGMLISSAVTPSFARKFEKKKLYNFYSVAGAVPFALVYGLYLVAGAKLLTFSMSVVMGLIFFMASWAQGGLNVLQSVMIADCVDYEEYHHGIRPDGVFFSGQSFITKLSAGIASIIQGLVFAVVGFSGGAVETLNNALANGTAQFATYNDGKFAGAMFFLVAVPPAIGMVLSAIPTWKYALPNNEHSKILSELVERRKEN